MIPYFLLYFIIMILLFKYHKSKKEKYFISIFIIIFLFSAMRGNGSGDYFTYLKYSQQIKNLNDVFDSAFPMEFGFRILSFIKNSLYLNDQFIIIFMNAISTFLTYTAINKFSKYKVLSVLLFMPILLQYDMHATRSAVAASMACLAVCYYYEANYRRSFLYLLGGFFFHRSVLVIALIPCFNFIHKKMTFKNYMRLYGCMLIASIFPIFKLIPYMAEKLNIVNVFIVKLYNYMFVSRFAYPLSLLDPRVILYILFFSLSVVLVMKHKTKKYEDICLLLFLNLLCLILFKDSTFLALRFSSFFERILMVFLPVLIIEIDFQPYKALKVTKWLANNRYLITVLIYSLYYFMLVILTCVPYVLFF